MSATRTPQPLDPESTARDPHEPTAVLGDDDAEAAPASPMQKPRGEDGFGLFYRFFFRFQYTLLHVIGPPRLTASMDPRTRMKKDYERRKELRQQWKAQRA